MVRVLLNASRRWLPGDLRDVAITWAVLAVALVVAVGTRLFDLHTAEPYAGDGLSHLFLVKTIIDTGWFAHSNAVGAPFGGDFLDYPFADGLHFVLIRAIGFVAGDWVATANIFFIASFFLASASGCIVLRRFGLSSPWAVAGGVLFALMPYHLLRRRHLLLASYFAVAIGTYLAVVAAAAAGRDVARPRALVLAVLAAVVGSTGIYYAFFSAFLVAVGGCLAMLGARQAVAGKTAMWLVLTIAVTVLVNALPSLVFRATNGPNPQAVVRNAAESEIHGLRMTQMLMPQPDHRIEAAAALAARYATTAPSISENQFAALGLVASAGFVLLLVVAIARIGGASIGPPPVATLAALGVAALLLGTMGGIGAWIAFTITPMIRAYNRISVFVGFISLAIALRLLQGWLSRTQIGKRPVAIVTIAAVVILVGVFDQTPYREDRAPDPAFASDRAFVRELESRVPAGTAVLQLPYQAYPEGGSVVGMDQYGPLRGPLHSTSLRWSYGAMRGRAGDVWIRALTGQEPSRMIDLAAKSGFGVVYVDRRGYADGGTSIEVVLRGQLGPPIATSTDGKLVAYALPKAGDAPVPIDALVSIDAPIALDREVLPAAVAGLRGFSGTESWGRWTEGDVAKIDFALPLPRKFVLKIAVTNAMPTNVDRDIVVTAGSAAARFRIPATRAAVVEVPLDTGGQTRSIEIHIPEPASPHRLGWSEDRRRLGIGIKSIAVVPAAS